MTKSLIDDLKFLLPCEGGEKVKFLTGIEALVLATRAMRERDVVRGFNTAGFITGYRGSPLAGLDNKFLKVRDYLQRSRVTFLPGLNEDLAVTSVGGKQKIGLFPGALYDGVFCMWYGKGPGVDRSIDALKHGNASGTSPLGGVLIVSGDDHDCKSSTMPHQSEFALRSAFIPTLYPRNVQEVFDYALLGWELSRHSGLFVGLKVIADVADSSGEVAVNPHLSFTVPDGIFIPSGGLNMRWPDNLLEQEERLKVHRLDALRELVRANNMNCMTHNTPTPRFGIVSSGKSHNDVLEALKLLGIDETRRQEIGIRIFKVAMPWPLEIESMKEFLSGLSHLLVVEEKLNVIETQLKEALYHNAVLRLPIIGKTTVLGKPYLPETGELSTARIAIAIDEQIPIFFRTDELNERVKYIEGRQALHHAKSQDLIERMPHFCSGCPHNTSTKVPEGSFAGAGIGCHYMAHWMPTNEGFGETIDVTQMGGEGAQWIGNKYFSNTKHIFQNLGDGTFWHSGSLAIRAAVAASESITFKILYNDAVAMTGGQPVDGPITPAVVTNLVYHEGVRKIALITDDLKKYRDVKHDFVLDEYAPGTTFHDRRELDAIQREFRTYEGVSVIVYEQTCAAEKRRRRKQKILKEPPRVVINPRVCEGCGDCSIKSNCLSVEPIETPFGRKRAINQSSCNKDYRCIDGFCPSFVTVTPGNRAIKKPTQTVQGNSNMLPDPMLPRLDEPYNIVLAGVGGTGVTMVAQILTMAAHLEKRLAMGLDMTGMAQKGGAVSSHVRIGDERNRPIAAEIPYGKSHLILGCDIVVTSTSATLSYANSMETAFVVNVHQSPTASVINNPHMEFPDSAMRKRIVNEGKANHVFFHDATQATSELYGDTMTANMYMLGYAYQRGYSPVHARAIEEAIRLNAVDVDRNCHAFHAGRLATIPQTLPKAEPADYATITRDLSEELRKYQSNLLAHDYLEFCHKVLVAENDVRKGSNELSIIVARAYFKLLAYKDEYEVARLHTDGEFLRSLKREFEGTTKLVFHMAPPILGRDKKTGLLKKRSFGPWIIPAMRLLAYGKVLRGTCLDVFGYSKERRAERKLIAGYQSDVSLILDMLTPDKYTQERFMIALELAKIPEEIRGYGHIKDKSIEGVQARTIVLRRHLESGHPLKLSVNEKLMQIRVVSTT